MPEDINNQWKISESEDEDKDDDLTDEELEDLFLEEDFYDDDLDSNTNNYSMDQS